MAGHPLRPATRQSLGRPLPHQQADRPRAHPPPKNFPPTPMRAMVISGINHRFRWLSQSGGQITHVLLTRSPLEYHKVAFPLDLHVLSTPPAFVLSQDQTLHRNQTPTPTQKASTGKREPHPPTPDKTLTKNIVRNYCPSSKKPPPQPTPTTQKATSINHDDGAKQTNSSTMTHC